MKKEKSNMTFRVDVPDFESKEEILGTIKKILELIENKDFVRSIHNDNKDDLEVKIKNGISFIISDCDCY